MVAQSLVEATEFPTWSYLTDQPMPLEAVRQMAKKLPKASFVPKGWSLRLKRQSDGLYCRLLVVARTYRFMTNGVIRNRLRKSWHRCAGGVLMVKN